MCALRSLGEVQWFRWRHDGSSGRSAVISLALCRARLSVQCRNETMSDWFQFQAKDCPRMTTTTVSQLKYTTPLAQDETLRVRCR